MNKIHPDLFQQRILSWFDTNGRKNLPWQSDITPYKTWISEIMLQQTQVATVIPYFNKFIQHFPDVQKLAEASIDSVLYLWAGLGYYARARNLHKAACIIHSKGQFPSDLNSLTELPGIGPSTAGAILSIAFNDSHPILDGNVKRVMARFHALSGWTGNSKVTKQLWEISSLYTSKIRCADYTQAIMDLGATVCTRSKPQCEQCPIQDHCNAWLTNQVSKIPSPKPAKKTPIKRLVFLMLQNKNNQVLLNKRPDSGIWGGLWSLPEFSSLSAAQSWCLQNNLPLHSIKQLSIQRHTFSHYHLDYTVALVKTTATTNKVMEENHSFWYKTEQIASLGLPAPIKKILENNFK